MALLHTLNKDVSHCESRRLDLADEQADTRPLPYDKLVLLHRLASQARFAVDLVGQGDDLARTA